MNTLLITDDPLDEAILSQAVRLAGMTVRTSRQLASCIEEWTEKPSDFLLIALRAPEPIQIVRSLRAVAIVPLVIIVESVSEDQHLDLLNAGADWVSERPYNTRLMVGYLKTLARRSAGVSRQSLPPLVHEEVQLDPTSRSVRVGEGPLQRLSQLEFRLLHTLMIHRGQVLPTETLVEHVWGYTGEGDRGLVRGLVNRLRTKIEPNPNNPQYICTVARVGYMFGGDEDA